MHKFTRSSYESKHNKTLKMSLDSSKPLNMTTAPDSIMEPHDEIKHSLKMYSESDCHSMGPVPDGEHDWSCGYFYGGNELFDIRCHKCSELYQQYKGQDMPRHPCPLSKKRTVDPAMQDILSRLIQIRDDFYTTLKTANFDNTNFVRDGLRIAIDALVDVKQCPKVKCI